jgi:ubiquitin related modifier 1
MFSGGLEMLFENKKALEIQVESTFSMKDLIEELRVKYLKEKEEMFFTNGSVRPGIIVLINDTDWELEETTAYKIQAGDRVAFISTLHGG